MNFKRVMDPKESIELLGQDEPSIMFSISSVQKHKPALLNNSTIRLEAPLQRLRVVFYHVLIVSMSHLPLSCAVLILASEAAFILYVIFVTWKYRYMENYLLLVSRINSSVAILIITFIACYICIAQGGRGQYLMPATLQFIGVGSLVFCMLLETIFLVVIVLDRVISFFKPKVRYDVTKIDDSWFPIMRSHWEQE